MHLESSIVIERSPEDVGRFLSEVSNIPSWDRGVADVRQRSAAPMGAGAEFDTIAHYGPKDAEGNAGRMSYRITETGEDYCKVQLTSSDGNARFFKDASWTFRLRPAEQGTRLECSVDFVLRLRYIVLAPMFLAMRGAITKDLKRLKVVMESS